MRTRSLAALVLVPLLSMCAEDVEVDDTKTEAETEDAFRSGFTLEPNPRLEAEIYIYEEAPPPELPPPPPRTPEPILVPNLPDDETPGFVLAARRQVVQLAPPEIRDLTGQPTCRISGSSTGTLAEVTGITSSSWTTTSGSSSSVSITQTGTGSISCTVKCVSTCSGGTCQGTCNRTCTTLKTEFRLANNEVTDTSGRVMYAFRNNEILDGPLASGRVMATATGDLASASKYRRLTIAAMLAGKCGSPGARTLFYGDDVNE